MSTLYPESYQIKPMKYGKHPSFQQVEKDLQSQKYIATLKKDGYSYYIEHTKSGYVYAFSRSVSKKTGELTEKSNNIPHIVEWVKKNIPRDTILCGEVYIPNRTSKDVTRIMGSLPEKAISRQKNEGWLHYYIFDIIKYDGKDMQNNGYEERLSIIYHYIKNLNLPNFIEIVSTVEGNNALDTVLSWINNGEEGAVIKKKDGIFKANGRPSFNYKIKKETDTLDFVIIAPLDPEYFYKGKEPETWPYKNDKGELITKAAYYNWYNGLSVGAYDDNGEIQYIGRVSSGLSDDMCKYITEHKNEIVGQVCEIQAMSLDKDALTFRHPFFVGLRPDKPKEDCKISEIFS